MLNIQELEMLMAEQPEEPLLRVSDLLPTSTPFGARGTAARDESLRSRQTTLERFGFYLSFKVHPT